MFKKVIISLIFFSIIIYTSNGNWNTFTLITEQTTFEKPHNSNVLRVYEDYLINPFSNSVITENTTTTISRANGRETTVINNYSVDGVIFNSSHPLHRSQGSRDAWINESDGIRTQILYLENTYEGSPLQPRQSVLIRKFYEVRFNHDETPPTCGDIELYNDTDLTVPYTHTPGAWLNQAKYFIMRCEDPETGCKCENDSCTIDAAGNVFSAPDVIGHLSQPTVTFWNNVNLNGECRGTLPGGDLLMYDQVAPRITASIRNQDGNIANFNYSNDSNRSYISNTDNLIEYELIEHVNIKANSDYRLILQIIDPYSHTSAHGTSGIKNITIKIDRKNHNESIYNNFYHESFSYEEFNPDGTRQTSDNKSFNSDNESLSIPHLLTTSGKYKIYIEAKDWAGNKTKATSFMNVFPSDIDLNNSIVILNGSIGEKFAHHTEKYEYKINLRDEYNNPIYDREIINVSSCEGISGCKELFLDMVDNTGERSININLLSSKTDSNGEIKFNASSIAPGIFSELFKIEMFNWDNNYEDTNIQTYNIGSLASDNYFKKPYTANLKSDIDNFLLGTTVPYELSITKNFTNSPNYNILDFSENIKALNEIDHDILDVTNLTNLNLNPKFNSTIIASSGAESLSLDNIGIKISPNPIITYNIGGKVVKYKLTEEANDFDNRPISISQTAEFNGVKIIGALQGSGYSDFTGQEDNFSDLSTSTIRTSIRRNAYEFTKSMSNGQIIGGVKYVIGDVKMSNENISNYETLVVRDGNVIIDSNFNPSNKMFGIIVLKDGYNTQSDFTGKGNVYIHKNVQNINAIIYADGGLISSNLETPYIEDTTNRTNGLSNQLVMNGSIFTRNTIGGAIKQPFRLPGGAIVNDFNKAMLYDLNYIRRGLDNCIKKEDLNDECKYEDSTFIIIYNPKITTTPPKLFGN